MILASSGIVCWYLPFLCWRYLSLFAGESLMLHGGIAAAFDSSCVYRLVWFGCRGGLGQVNVFSSHVFGGISGSGSR